MSGMTRRTLLAAAGAACAPRTLLAASRRPPNIVIILCDDLGYGDLGCYGSRIRTPSLDRMASEGVRFTNFCAADPVCSPSRAALLTGRYPTRVDVPRVLFPQDTGGLNLEESTLANVLKNTGYRTMCIGKWHLGRPTAYLPTSRGFDTYFGIPYSNDMNPRVLMRDTEVIEQTADLNTLTQRYTDEAKRFIESAKAGPFFLYMPHTFPHIPLGASPRFRG
jgi:arylsulfatase